MTTLLVSGDSWTSGWPMEQRLGHRNFSWPNLVSSHFDFKLIDKSRASTSNYRIYRKAFDGIVSQECQLVLVFLSTWARFEIGATYGEKPGRIYQHTPHQPGSEEIFWKFFNGYKSYTDMLRSIISLQSLSDIKNIPCYFLDTYDNNLHQSISLSDFQEIISYNHLEIDNMHDDRIMDKLEKVKMLEKNIDFSRFISCHSYQSMVDGCKIEQGHPGEDGHKKIADIVINFLEGKTLCL